MSTEDPKTASDIMVMYAEKTKNAPAGWPVKCDVCGTDLWLCNSSVITVLDQYPEFGPNKDSFRTWCAGCFFIKEEGKLISGKKRTGFMEASDLQRSEFNRKFPEETIKYFEKTLPDLAKALRSWGK